MRSFGALTLSCVLAFTSLPAAAKPVGVCDFLLSKVGLTKDEGVKRARRLAREAERQLDRGFRRKGYGLQAAKGYAIVLAAMVGSAALLAYITVSLPSDPVFTTLFISNLMNQVTTAFMYLGAPIMEPFVSRFRKFVFDVKNLADHAYQPRVRPGMNQQWERTQGGFSLNEQMSRNLIGGVINVLSVNFNEARDAHRAKDHHLAASQIAEAAYRLRELYDDVLPTNRPLAAMVWTTFTDHCPVDDDFLARIWRILKKLDRESTAEPVRAYYEELLKIWFEPDWADTVVEQFAEAA